MNLTIRHGLRNGSVCIPSSKSFAHRLLICAALAKTESTVICDGISKDIDATIKCLNALGAKISVDGNKLSVDPIETVSKEQLHLYCGESGSTLRFLIPVVGALGADAVFHMEGKLSQRPLDALIKTLTANSMSITQCGELLYCKGKLTAGSYCIPGNISSQYISGMLFALPLLDGNSTLEVTGKVESKDYIIMTEEAVTASGVLFTKNGNNYNIYGSQKYVAGKNATVERDWSNAAFFMCMGAFSDKGVTLTDMRTDSKQGDMAIIDILSSFGAEVTCNDGNVTVKKGNLRGITVDAAAIPDLIPTISALASGAKGTTKIINAERLRLKESDRLQTTSAMLSALGADITETKDGLIINGKEKLSGGTIDAANDHRIAMSAAVAACICEDDVTIDGAQCVNKSYPEFWNHFESLEVTV